MQKKRIRANDAMPGPIERLSAEIARVAKAKLDDSEIYLQFIQRVENRCLRGVVRVVPHKKDPCSGVYSRDFNVAREKY